MPAIPNTGNALVRRFRFEACFARAIESSPILIATDCANRLRRHKNASPSAFGARQTAKISQQREQTAGCDAKAIEDARSASSRFIHACPNVPDVDSLHAAARRPALQKIFTL